MSKVELGESLKALYESRKIAYIRPHFVFSPEDGRPRILGEYLSTREGRAFKLRDPRRTADFIHIFDVVQGLSQIVEHEATGLLDLASGVEISLHGFLARFGYKSQQDFTEVPRRKHLDTLVPLENLGWRPRKTIEVLGYQDILKV